MIDTTKYWMEDVLQKWRFAKAKRYVAGDVLDFGGNRGEFADWMKVRGKYICINDISDMSKKDKFDTILMLAVLEHIDLRQVKKIVSILVDHMSEGGKIVITTPSPKAEKILDLLSGVGFLSKENISEHKKYWDTKEVIGLLTTCGVRFVDMEMFMFGFNQLFVFSKNGN